MFSQYLISPQFRLDTDHKPLVPCLSNKQLAQLPNCAVRFCLWTLRYDSAVHHVPDEQLLIADIQSLPGAILHRSFGGNLSSWERKSIPAEATVSLPATDTGLQARILPAQQEDAAYLAIAHYSCKGWLPCWALLSFISASTSTRSSSTTRLSLHLHRAILTQLHTGHSRSSQMSPTNKGKTNALNVKNTPVRDKKSMFLQASKR